MALKTDLQPNRLYDFSSLIENGQVVLFDSPLMFYPRESSQDNCTIVLDRSQNEFGHNLNLPEIILDGDYFQFPNVPPNSRHGDGDLAVLEILCNNSTAPARPEFVDIDKLTGGKAESAAAKNVVSVSDDDDVVFVKEYKKEDEDVSVTVENKEINESVAGTSNWEKQKVRRNPVRTTRNKSRVISQEVLYEEDFAFLDTTDEEDDDIDTKPPEKNRDPLELPKEWPINVHERPEYNCETRRIESFDYTIREIQKKVPVKKPRLETVAVRRESKKKYLTRRKKSKAVITEKKVPLEELQPLVNSTTEVLKGYFLSLVGSDIHDRIELLRNQTLLFSLVNDLPPTDALKKLDNYLKDKS